MKKLLALSFGLALAGGALAAQIPAGYVGVNYGGDITVAAGTGTHGSGVYPVYTTFDRIYDASVGTTFHATWWSTINTSAGVYNWQPLDQILASEQAKNKVTEYTLSGVPAYVNGSQKVSGSTQLTQFSTFLSAMMTHVAANGQCFGYFSLWNEVNQPSTYWTGTAAELAALSAVAYPLIKANCPHTIVLSASTTSGVDTGASPNPNGPFQYLNAYLAACTSGCFDAVNVHGYPQVPSLQTSNTDILYAPELLANTITNAQAVAVANGFSAGIYLDEGYAASDPASIIIPANTTAYASAQAQQLIIGASAGVVSYANSFFGTGCVAQAACGNEFVNSAKVLDLTSAGLAKRQIVGWLSGATFSTPYARGQGTNLITSAPNAASVATGNIGGSGGSGCPTPPAGTGSLPVGASPWGLSATASIASGMSYYVVGSGSTPYIDVRICGTDTSGNNSDSIRMNNFTGAATQGQQVVIAACLGLSAGTLAGIQEIDLQVNEYTSVPAYANEFMVQSQIQPVLTSLVPVTSQCFQTRYTMKAATAAFAVPYILIKHYGSIAIDATFRIASPHLDVNSTRWSGIVTKSGGYQATIAADASGSGSITAPAGTVGYRDVYGKLKRVSPGDTVPLTQSPVIIENTLPKAYIPATPVAVSGFVVAPTMGGSDSNAGTLLSPFATLSKCHSAMIASGTKTCYVRGAVTAASWPFTNGETGLTWHNYPGDAAYSTNIAITGTTSSCSGCGVTIYGLKISGTSATQFASVFTFSAPSGLNIWDNHFTSGGVVGMINMFNANNTNIQGNSFTAPTSCSGTNVITLNMTNTDNLDHSNVVVSDNGFVGTCAFVIQQQTQGSTTVLHNYHFDRNTFTNYGDSVFPSFGIEAISWVGGPTLSNDHVTLYGNIISQPSGNTLNDSGFELGTGNVTVQNNITSYTRFTYDIGVGGNFLGNVAIPQTGFQGVFGGTGLYSAPNTWLGTNTVAGTPRTGCVTGAGGCTLSPAPSASQVGGIWAASPVWSQ